MSVFCCACVSSHLVHVGGGPVLIVLALDPVAVDVVAHVAEDLGREGEELPVGLELVQQPLALHVGIVLPASDRQSQCTHLCDGLAVFYQKFLQFAIEIKSNHMCSPRFWVGVWVCGQSRLGYWSLSASITLHAVVHNIP